MKRLLALLAVLAAALPGVAVAKKDPSEPYRSRCDNTHVFACIHRAAITKHLSYAWLVSTIGCETGRTYDPQIVSPGGTYHGLGQFDAQTWAGLPYASRSWHSAKWNTLAMGELYNRRGTAPWPVCG